MLGRHVETYGSAAFPSEMTLSWTRNYQGQYKPCNTVLPSLSQKSNLSQKLRIFLLTRVNYFTVKPHEGGLCERLHSCYQENVGGLLDLLEGLLALLWGWCEEGIMWSSRNYVRAGLGASLLFSFCESVGLCQWGCHLRCTACSAVTELHKN